MVYVVTRWLFALLLVVAPISAGAQSLAERFAETDWFSRPVGKGVTWKYYHFDHLFVGPQNISVIEADINEPGVNLDLAYRFGSFARTSHMLRNDFTGTAAGVNGTFYQYNEGISSHRTFFRRDGVEIQPANSWSNWGYQGGLVFNRNTGTANVIPRPINSGGAGGALANWRSINNQYTDVMVNGPLLVRNGNLTPGEYGNITSHCTARHPRTMVGTKGNNVILLVVADGRHAGRSVGLTCDEMAQVMQALGSVRAVSLDGGGSSAMYVRGEANGGIVNYPSDNGQWDHAGERSVSNAIAVIAPEPDPLPFDARAVVVSRLSQLGQGETGQVIVRLTNIGELPWNNGRISLTTGRPAMKPSEFYTPESWSDEATAWQLPEGTTVNAGESILASFQVTGPSLPATGSISEFFRVTLDGTTRIGPADDALPIAITVSGDTDHIIVEPRSGGQNVAWYSESGVMGDSGVSTVVPGATEGIGSRYGSTYRSVAGAKAAHWRPVFPQNGYYRVHVAWPAATSRRSPITYKIHHSGGTETYQIDQSVNANEWITLDPTPYEFEAGQNNQGVEMTNENIDLSGSMYAGPVWFEYVPDASVADWELY